MVVTLLNSSTLSEITSGLPRTEQYAGSGETTAKTQVYSNNTFKLQGTISSFAADVQETNTNSEV